MYDDVLALAGDPVSFYRGRAYLYPFAQGGEYWRVASVRDLFGQCGPMHYIGLDYIEDERGQPKRGFRDLRGHLTAVRDDDGRVLVHRSGEHWHVEDAPRCERCEGILEREERPRGRCRRCPGGDS